MRAFLIFVAGLISIATSPVSAGETLIYRAGCFKKSDLVELMTTERANGPIAATVVAMRRKFEETCVGAILLAVEYDTTLVEQGIRAVMGYPFPNISPEKSLDLFLDGYRPSKQLIYFVDIDSQSR